MTVTESPNNADPERRVDLDWVRIGAFGLLILYHIGLLYVPWSYHVKSTHVIQWLEPLMLLFNPWRLTLLFFVSGVATRFMARKYVALRLLASRTLRLLPPLIFGMFVIVPPQAYDQVVESAGYTGSFLEFYVSYYFTFGVAFCHPGPCLLLPTWNHLWFVAYLWVYTVAVGSVLLIAPNMLGVIERGSLRVLSGVRLLIVPACMLIAYRALLLPYFPKTNALFGDWYNHAVYGTVFLLGFLFALSDEFWSGIDRFCRTALVVAAGSYIVFIAIRTSGIQPTPATRFVSTMAYGFYQWCCIVAVLGYTSRWLTRDSAVRRYLTDAVFPYYIVHQTAIVMIAHQLKTCDMPVWCEAGIVIAGTIAACAATYELVRRVTPLRPLFGLRLYEPANRSRTIAEGPVEARTGNS